MPDLKLSPTRIQTFQRCKQRYHWTYEEKGEPTGDQEALVRGSTYHEGMAAYFRDGDWQDIASAMWMELSGRTGMLDESQLQEFFLACRILRSYIQQDRDAWAAEGVEEWVEGSWVSPSGDTIRLLGKWDLVAYSLGKRWIVDHKFSRNTSNGRVYDYSLQAGMYLLQAQLTGREVEGVIFNLINYQTGKVQKKTVVLSKRFLDNLRKELETISRDMQSYTPVRSFSHTCPWECPFAVQCLERMEK
jgi:hypothetical protein